MKSLFRISLFVLIGLLILVACSPAAQSMAVQLPAELIAVIGMVVMVAVTGAFKWLGARIGQDLSDQAKVVAAALSTVIVLAINYAFSIVPSAYDNFITAALSFLVVFLGGTGIYSFWKRIPQ